MTARRRPPAPRRPTPTQGATASDIRTRGSSKQYDRRYFDRWYRDPRHRVLTRTLLERRVTWAIATAEHVLDRPLRNVLDVGCGEAHWAPVVRRLRPTVRYVGVDPSPYVLARYGVRRNILAGTLETLGTLELDGPFDLVVCCAMLNYLAPAVVARGLREMKRVLGGVAHIELFARGDPVTGDFTGWRWYSPDWARRAFRRAGLRSIGLQCYATGERIAALCALESGD